MLIVIYFNLSEIIKKALYLFFSVPMRECKSINISLTCHKWNEYTNVWIISIIHASQWVCKKQGTGNPNDVKTCKQFKIKKNYNGWWMTVRSQPRQNHKSMLNSNYIFVCETPWPEMSSRSGINHFIKSLNINCPEHKMISKKYRY